MNTSNSLIGTLLHAIGGISAASCYLPSTKTKGWSWNTFWLAQSVFAWLLVPLLLAWLTSQRPLKSILGWTLGVIDVAKERLTPIAFSTISKTWSINPKAPREPSAMATT